MNKQKTLTLYLVAAAILALSSQLIIHYRIPPLAPPPEGTRQFSPAHQFVLGVNYPWLNYGYDFGDHDGHHNGISVAANSSRVERDFANLEAQKVSMVRWWLWADGRAGIQFTKDGKVTRLDTDFFLDVDEAVAIAKRHRIKIVFVLVDFLFFEGPSYGLNGHNWGGHDAVVINSRARDSFLKNAVQPLLEHYGNEETIAAWDIVNEPEWELGKSFRWGRKEFDLSQMRDFIGVVVECIHRYAKQPATVGSVSISLLPLWQTLGLDFYETHQYPYTSLIDVFQLQSPSSLNRPIVLGEYPTKNSSRSPISYLNQAYNDGFAGAFAWSYHASDPYSNYATWSKRITGWKRKH